MNNWSPEKRGLRKRYIHHRNLFLKGYGEVSMVIGLFNQAMLLWLFVRDFAGLSRRWIWIVPACMCLVSIGLYVVGWIWERRGLFREDLRWQTERNPMWLEMMEMIRREKNEAHKRS